MNRNLEDPSDGTEGLRKVSKALFGSRYRLSIAAAVAEGPSVTYAREIAQRLGVPDNQVHLEFRHFEGARLLSRMERVPGQRQQYFLRLDSAFWELARRFNEELERTQLDPAVADVAE